jgi:hypothetical protein
LSSYSNEGEQDGDDGFIHVRFVDYLFFLIIIYVAEAKICRLGALNILNGIKSGAKSSHHSKTLLKDYSDQSSVWKEPM